MFSTAINLLLEEIYDPALEQEKNDRNKATLEKKLNKRSDAILESSIASQLISEMIDIEINRNSSDEPVINQNKPVIPAKINPADYFIFSFDLPFEGSDKSLRGSLYIPRKLTIENSTQKKACIATPHGQFGTYVPVSEYISSLNDKQLEILVKNAKESLTNKKLTDLPDLLLVEVISLNARLTDMLISKSPSYQVTKIKKLKSASTQATIQNTANYNDSNHLLDLFEKAKKIILQKKPNLIEKLTDAALEMDLQIFAQAIIADELAIKLMMTMIELNVRAKHSIDQLTNESEFSNTESQSSDEANEDHLSDKSEHELNTPHEEAAPATIFSYSDQMLASLISEDINFYRHLFTANDPLELQHLGRAVSLMRLYLQVNLLDNIFLEPSRQNDNQLTLLECEPSHCLTILTSLNSDVLRDGIGTLDELDMCLGYVSSDGDLSDDNSLKFLVHFGQLLLLPSELNRFEEHQGYEIMRMARSSHHQPPFLLKENIINNSSYVKKGILFSPPAQFDKDDVITLLKSYLFTTEQIDAYPHSYTAAVMQLLIYLVTGLHPKEDASIKNLDLLACLSQQDAMAEVIKIGNAAKVFIKLYAYGLRAEHIEALHKANGTPSITSSQEDELIQQIIEKKMSPADAIAKMTREFNKHNFEPYVDDEFDEELYEGRVGMGYPQSRH